MEEDGKIERRPSSDEEREYISDGKREDTFDNMEKLKWPILSPGGNLTWIFFSSLSILFIHEVQPKQRRYSKGNNVHK